MPDCGGDPIGVLIGVLTQGMEVVRFKVEVFCEDLSDDDADLAGIKLTAEPQPVLDFLATAHKVTREELVDAVAVKVLQGLRHYAEWLDVAA